MSTTSKTLTREMENALNKVCYNKLLKIMTKITFLIKMILIFCKIYVPSAESWRQFHFRRKR